MSFVNIIKIGYLFLILVIWIIAFTNLLIIGFRFFFFRKNINALNAIKNHSSINPFVKIGLNIVMLSAITVLISLLILRPIFGNDLTQVSATNIDIIFLIDTSQSMKVEDFGSNKSRLDGAKQVLTEFVKNDTGRRYGVISFCYKAHTEVPLTYDKQTIITGIDTLYPVESYNARGGSSINVGLVEAKERLLNSKDKFSQNRQKIIIVVTDGEEVGKHTEKWDDTVKDLKSNGIRVFTLGIGTTNGGKVPQYEYLDGTVSYVRYNGEEVISKIDESNLQELAKAGGGEYYHGTPDFDTKELSKDLTEYLQTTTINIDTEIYRESYFLITPVLLILFIIFELDVLSPVRILHKKKK